jgi:hypothetical protein
MNKHQRISTAKYLYDISKGVALLAVVGGLLSEQWNIPRLIIGAGVSFIFFTFAYLIEKPLNN